MKTRVEGKHLTGERALFGASELEIYDTIFADGESPLKESRDISLHGSMFKWKYPLWYSKNITAVNCVWFEGARAGVWYSENIELCDCQIEAPKNFRRCKGLSLKNISIPNASETLWHCSDVKAQGLTASGAYFAMNSNNMEIDRLTLFGDYPFDGAENIEIRNSRLLSKDAFWNCKNVTVYDSFISGEYLGWNSENLTFVNCTLESLQGLCYINNLKLKNCKLINTTLAFEYSSVEAEISGKIDSVMNPSCGMIKADKIDELIIMPDRVDPEKTRIICK